MSEIILTTKSELEEIIASSLKRFNLQNFISFQQDDTVMNQKQAAEFLGISQSTLISWKKKNLVPYEQLPGSSKVRYYKTQLKLVCQKNPGLLQAARK
jgi:predicted DNA-binding transcriptional regulator AlpA